ncbi:MAG: exopolyphosphatase [Flavobacteriales bacterium]|nr:exopolyphosphatase [Flavobacteriales bacterium]
MKLAAIDIGSNAVRLLIAEIFELKDGYHTQKVSFTRIPIRLGEDVFEYGAISHQKSVQMVKVMRAFWYLMDVHNIEFFRACATSAMREASNSSEVIDLVRKEANINIEIIDGEEEANLIFSNFFVQNIDHSKSYLYIDVGGGSTELTLIQNGKRKKAKSFKIGTVRTLKGKTKESHWEAAAEWLKEIHKEAGKLTGIATGGNINRLYKMSRCAFNEPFKRDELEEIAKVLKKHSYEERMYKLGLKPDRADVIIPASDIYLRMFKLAKVNEMIVPKIGLSDGIVLGLYEDWKKSIKKA